MVNKFYFLVIFYFIFVFVFVYYIVYEEVFRYKNLMIVKYMYLMLCIIYWDILKLIWCVMYIYNVEYVFCLYM